MDFYVQNPANARKSNGNPGSRTAIGMVSSVLGDFSLKTCIINIRATPDKLLAAHRQPEKVALT